MPIIYQYCTQLWKLNSFVVLMASKVNINNEVVEQLEVRIFTFIILINYSIVFAFSICISENK